MTTEVHRKEIERSQELERALFEQERKCGFGPGGKWANVEPEHPKWKECCSARKDLEKTKAYIEYRGNLKLQAHDEEAGEFDVAGKVAEKGWRQAETQRADNETELRLQLADNLKALQGQSLKDAVEKWILNFPKIDNLRILVAVTDYILDPSRTYRRTAAKMGVTAKTISQWVAIFEEKTGERLLRPAPGQNISIRNQAKMEAEAQQRLPARKKDTEHRDSQERLGNT